MLFFAFFLACLITSSNASLAVCSLALWRPVSGGGGVIVSSGANFPDSGGSFLAPGVGEMNTPDGLHVTPGAPGTGLGGGGGGGGGGGAPPPGALPPGGGFIFLPCPPSGNGINLSISSHLLFRAGTDSMLAT